MDISPIGSLGNNLRISSEPKEKAPEQKQEPAAQESQPVASNSPEKGGSSVNTVA